MDRKKISEVERDLRILEYIEREPDITQAGLAAKLGVAVGSVNWYMKRMLAKGHVKAKRMRRKRLRYLITPQGMAEKGRLAYEYMQASLHVYREVRTEAKRLLGRVQAAGYREVRIEGDGDVAEICRLTCLEQGVQIEPMSEKGRPPVLRVDGRGLKLEWLESNSGEVKVKDYLNTAGWPENVAEVDTGRGSRHR
jgi:DNA-binding MarR family transcriptional regulator